jgi:hypothetical protein
MGLVPPPKVMTKEEWLKAGRRDLRLEHWAKYEVNSFVAIYYFIKEKVLRIK